MNNEVGAGLSRKERNRLRHRREIMAAAERVFMRKGYYSATVDEIAQEAEFAVGTLYTVFDGKNDLFNQLIETLIREYMSKFQETVMKAATPEEAVKKLVNVRIQFYIEHYGFFKVFIESLNEVRSDNSMQLPLPCIDLYEKYITDMSQKIQEGIKKGVFIDEDPVYLVLLINSITHSFMLHWSWKNADRIPSDSFERLSDLVLQTICLNKPYLKEKHK